MREVINGIFYILVAGYHKGTMCAWHLLPHDLPKGKTVYHYFRQWRIDGDWQRIHERLRQWVRAIEDRHPNPSAAIEDSQSVETATMIHPEVGYDGGQKIKGRKRHLLVDTLGLMMVVVVTAASLPERDGAKLVFEKAAQSQKQVNRLVTIWVDGGYRGINFMRWVMDTYRWIDSPVLRSNHARGFKVLPRRWVEITHFWLVLLVSQCGLARQFVPKGIRASHIGGGTPLKETVALKDP